MPREGTGVKRKKKLAQMVVSGCSLDHMTEALFRPILGIKRKIKRLGLMVAVRVQRNPYHQEQALPDRTMGVVKQKMKRMGLVVVREEGCSPAQNLKKGV